jgi:uncharacterized protein YfaS (alpha-2-macroglobulin family)
MNLVTPVKIRRAQALTLWCALVFGVFSFVAPLPSQAQVPAEGSISGSVRNVQTNSFLEGVVVLLEGTTLTATTQRGGGFNFNRVPAGRYTRGDVLRIALEVRAGADMSWAVITDPVPAGATILGSGLGRDSEMATQREKKSADSWPAFEERSFESFRSYYAFLPKGVVKIEYTIRLNNAGDFSGKQRWNCIPYLLVLFGSRPLKSVVIREGL